MKTAPLSVDGFDRAITGANRTTRAGTLNYFIADQSPANFGRATFLVDVSIVLFPEQLQRADDWVWSALPEAAQASSADLIAQTFQ